MILTNLDEVIVEYTLRFNFDITNNIAEYEALIVALKILKELDTKEIKVFSDSQLFLSQVRSKYEANDPTISKYLQKIKDLSTSFEKLDVQRIPRSKNA